MSHAPETGSAISPRPAPRAELAVVHLVRHVNGIDVLRRFLASYARHDAGAEHELVLVLKGFAEAAALVPYQELLADLGARVMHVGDHGFDLGAYRRAALELPHRRLLLLNSFSEILVERWLERLLTIASEPRIAAVAASGSWGSQASHTRYNLGLGGPYAQIFPDLAATNSVFERLAPEPEPEPAVAGPRPRSGRLALAQTIARQTLGFAAFPSPHLRTNGLLVERERWLSACRSEPRDKLAAHRLESGRGGITARLRAGGREVAVVGRDGRAYAEHDWPESFTFWQGEQQNLLIADNQTRAYERGDELLRRVLSAYAWGARAQHLPPTPSERLPR